MISPRLRELIEAARNLLPENEEWQMMNSMPRREPKRLTIEVPEDYRELLQVTDGIGAGPVTVFGSKYVAQNQTYTGPIEGTATVLDPETWFCFGSVDSDPLLIHRKTDAVHGFPESGVTWWQSSCFEQYAPNIDAFLTEHVFGPEYPNLVGETDDEWCHLLRRLVRLDWPLGIPAYTREADGTGSRRECSSSMPLIAAPKP